MLRNGSSNTVILEHLNTKYNLKKRQSVRLLHDALADLQEATSDIDLSETKALYIERVESMLEKALSSGDIKTALRCQDMLNKMNGLYIDKQELTVTNDIIKFNFDS